MSDLRLVLGHVDINPHQNAVPDVAGRMRAAADATVAERRRIGQLLALRVRELRNLPLDSYGHIHADALEDFADVAGLIIDEED